MLVLRGQSYTPHSAVNLNVLDYANNVLQCYTNRQPCCRDGQLGEWLFPNGTTVKINSTGDDFYRNRGASVVNLNWRDNSRIPTGLFCCVIPNPENPELRACIGVYPEDEGNHLSSC